MPAVPGFVGPANITLAINGDAEDTINFYLEATAPGTGKVQWQFLPTPGLRRFLTFTTNPVNTTKATGQAFSLTAVTSGNPAPADYLWWHSTNGGVTWSDWNYITGGANGNGTHNSSLNFTSAQVTSAINGNQWKVCIWQPGFFVRNVSTTATPSLGAQCSSIATTTITP